MAVELAVGEVEYRPPGTRIGDRHDFDPLTERCLWCGMPRRATAEVPGMGEHCEGEGPSIEWQREAFERRTRELAEEVARGR